MVSGDNPLDRRVKPAPGSGPIFVRARDLTVEDSEIRVLTVTNQPAGDVSIDLTGDLTVRGTGEQRSLINSGSGLTIPVPPDQIATSVFREVDPSIGLVRDFFVCGNAICGVTYLTPAPAGDISISARNLTLENGGQLVSRSEFQGDAGEIRLDLTGDATIQRRGRRWKPQRPSQQRRGIGRPGPHLARYARRSPTHG